MVGPKSGSLSMDEATEFMTPLVAESGVVFLGAAAERAFPVARSSTVYRCGGKGITVNDVCAPISDDLGIGRWALPIPSCKRPGKTIRITGQNARSLQIHTDVCHILPALSLDV